MTFSIHIDDETGEAVGRLAAELGQSRNAVIAAAVREFLEHRRKQAWSPEVLQMLTHPTDLAFPAFESYRAELPAPRVHDV